MRRKKIKIKTFYGAESKQAKQNNAMCQHRNQNKKTIYHRKFPARHKRTKECSSKTHPENTLEIFIPNTPNETLTQGFPIKNSTNSIFIKIKTFKKPNYQKPKTLKTHQSKQNYTWKKKKTNKKKIENLQ